MATEVSCTPPCGCKYFTGTSSSWFFACPCGITMYCRRCQKRLSAYAYRHGHECEQFDGEECSICGEKFYIAGTIHTCTWGPHEVQQSDGSDGGGKLEL